MDKTICKNLTNVPSATFNIITNDTFKVLFPGGRGGGGTWVNFCWVCATGLSDPLPHYSLFCDQNTLLGKYVIFAIPT